MPFEFNYRTNAKCRNTITFRTTRLSCVQVSCFTLQHTAFHHLLKRAIFIRLRLPVCANSNHLVAINALNGQRITIAVFKHVTSLQALRCYIRSSLRLGFKHLSITTLQLRIKRTTGPSKFLPVLVNKHHSLLTCRLYVILMPIYLNTAAI